MFDDTPNDFTDQYVMGFPAPSLADELWTIFTMFKWICLFLETAESVL
jgi:hypothetical protein